MAPLKTNKKRKKENAQTKDRTEPSIRNAVIKIKISMRNLKRPSNKYKKNEAKKLCKKIHRPLKMKRLKTNEHRIHRMATHTNL